MQLFGETKCFRLLIIRAFILSLILLHPICHGSDQVLRARNDGGPVKINGDEPKNIRSDGLHGSKGRSVASLLLQNWDPGAIWKSASQMMQKGVRVFRESLHEGVKVATMLRDDMDEGVTHIWGQGSNHQEAGDGEHKEQDGIHLSSSDGSSEKVAEDSAVDTEATTADYLYPASTARGGMLDGIFRFMNARLDSSKIGMIVFNILIFIAESLANSLLGKNTNSIPEARALKQGVMEWMATGDSPVLKRFAKDATSETLPESLIETLKRRTGNNTACVQLLVCKLSPIIWGVQRTVEKKFETTSSSQNNDNTNKETPRSFWSQSVNLLDDLMTSFPSKDGFVKFGDNCERRFPNCRLLKFKKTKKKQRQKTKGETMKNNDDEEA